MDILDPLSDPTSAIPPFIFPSLDDSLSIVDGYADEVGLYLMTPTIIGCSEEALPEPMYMFDDHNTFMTGWGEPFLDCEYAFCMFSTPLNVSAVNQDHHGNSESFAQFSDPTCAQPSIYFNGGFLCRFTV